jgi:hypothetical protein
MSVLTKILRCIKSDTFSITGSRMIAVRMIYRFENVSM